MTSEQFIEKLKDLLNDYENNKEPKTKVSNQIDIFDVINETKKSNNNNTHIL